MLLLSQTQHSERCTLPHVLAQPGAPRAAHGSRSQPCIGPRALNRDGNRSPPNHAFCQVRVLFAYSIENREAAPSMQDRQPSLILRIEALGSDLAQRAGRCLGEPPQSTSSRRPIGGLVADRCSLKRGVSEGGIRSARPNRQQGNADDDIGKLKEAETLARDIRRFWESLQRGPASLSLRLQCRRLSPALLS